MYSLDLPTSPVERQMRPVVYASGCMRVLGVFVRYLRVQLDGKDHSQDHWVPDQALDRIAPLGTHTDLKRQVPREGGVYLLYRCTYGMYRLHIHMQSIHRHTQYVRCRVPFRLPFGVNTFSTSTTPPTRALPLHPSPNPLCWARWSSFRLWDSPPHRPRPRWLSLEAM
jgi:hypothetical protein